MPQLRPPCGCRAAVRGPLRRRGLALRLSGATKELIEKTTIAIRQQDECGSNVCGGDAW